MTKQGSRANPSRSSSAGPHHSEVGSEKIARRSRATATQAGLQSLPETDASRIRRVLVERYWLVACPQAKQRAE